MSQLASLTFVSSSRGRGCEEIGAHSLTYRETVFATGEVHCVVTGFDEDGTVNTRAVRPSRGPVDLAVVKAARLASGWTVRS